MPASIAALGDSKVILKMLNFPLMGITEKEIHE
jgi:hypothetical protein